MAFRRAGRWWPNEHATGVRREPCKTVCRPQPDGSVVEVMGALLIDPRYREEIEQIINEKQ